MSEQDRMVRMIEARLGASDFQHTVKFDLGEAGIYLLKGGAIHAQDGDADCVISISRSDLENLMQGDLDPMSAFMSGKITVEGDMSVAMSLAQAL